ncbi:MAG: hypothetical protein JXB88_04690 [Spirochaetales bacterium]|nr:hypothetical protein [Spirochaetales bacterium]
MSKKERINNGFSGLRVFLIIFNPVRNLLFLTIQNKKTLNFADFPFIDTFFTGKGSPPPLPDGKDNPFIICPGDRSPLPVP